MLVSHRRDGFFKTDQLRPEPNQPRRIPSDALHRQFINYGWQMIIAPEEYVDLKTQYGPMRTYVLTPAAAGRYPGLVLFSEIFQVTGPIRRRSAQKTAAQAPRPVA